MATGTLLALTAGACFGLSNVLGRIAISRSSVYTTAVWSLVPSALALPAVVAVLALAGRVGAADLRSVPYFVAAGVSADFVARLSLIGAVERLGASRAVAFRVLAPLVSIAVGLLLLGERLSRAQAVGITLILAGIMVVQADGLRPGPRREPSDPSEGGDAPASPSDRASHRDWGHAGLAASQAGDVVFDHGRGLPWVRRGLAYGLLAGLSFGVADIFRKTGVSHGHPVFGAFVTSSTAMLLYLVGGWRRGIRRHLRPPRQALLPLTAVGTAILFAVVLFITALQHIPVALGSTLSGTQVLFAILFGWLINQTVEQVSRRVVAGGVLAFSGFAVVIGA